MQTITDFICLKMPTNEPVFVSHRNNTEHIVNGASDSLVWQGIVSTRTTKDLSAWIGDIITVVDYNNKPMYKAVVLAKTVREWDMSKPTGQRLASQKKSAHWDTVFGNYNAYIKQKRG